MTIPGLLLLSALDFVLLPVLLVAAAAFDAIRHRPFVAVRFQLAVAFAFAMHLVALVLITVAWIMRARWAGLWPDREARLDARIEVWLAERIWRCAVRLFRVSMIVEGQETLERGPFVLMCRHASVLDVILPPILSHVPGLSLRYVIKRELLWDPCIDLLGHRLPNVFVRRAGNHPAEEIAHVAALADGLRPTDVVVVFPEGTRFAPAKRERVLARLAVVDPPSVPRAQRLQHVLPPHPGGPLALIERSPTTDIVFCAHTGLEGANHLRDLATGAVIGATVRVRCWRVPASEIPETYDARVRWLFEWWETIDEWVARHQVAAPSRA